MTFLRSHMRATDHVDCAQSFVITGVGIVCGSRNGGQRRCSKTVGHDILTIYFILSNLFQRCLLGWHLRFDANYPIRLNATHMLQLALDIGTKRTGVAFLDDAVGVPVALPTIEHADTEDLLAAVLLICRERSIDEVIVGLPLLPSGKEGKQAKISRAFAELLESAGVAVSYRDERYTTIREEGVDRDAAAAVQLLQ